MKSIKTVALHPPKDSYISNKEKKMWNLRGIYALPPHSTLYCLQDLVLNHKRTPQLSLIVWPCKICTFKQYHHLFLIVLFASVRPVTSCLVVSNLASTCSTLLPSLALSNSTVVILQTTLPTLTIINISSFL
ncbi:hypothetical protein RRG08_055201 [Elysia crispata]|uniref:Uncharacterized protein n=1 Tax=Elysia crispata TaxID=231223 RepID=A0AAE0YWB5_9GAST|nr:hypothetical protein RRG08_055201 [Elysia crispata]